MASSRTSQPTSASHAPFQEADEALFEGKLQGLVVTCFENERPLRGLAGLLDWRFQGAISQCLKVGAVTGRAGEVVYMPMTRIGKTYHLILVGGGEIPSEAQDRSKIPAESLKALQKNLSSLKLGRLGVSRADFGGVDEAFFGKNLKGISLEVVP